MKHVTIQTKQMDKSIEFYEKIVGLTIQQDMRKGGDKPIVFLADGPNETCVELIENMENPYSGEGISLGFKTEDVEGKREALIKEGYDVTPIISPNPHVKFFFTEDPNGLKIQFI